MEKVNTFGQVVVNSLVIEKMVKKMDKVNTFGQMVANTLVIGKMVNKMATVKRVNCFSMYPLATWPAS